MKIPNDRPTDYGNNKFVVALLSFILIGMGATWLYKNYVDKPINDTTESQSSVNDSLEAVNLKKERVESYLTTLSVLDKDEPWKKYSSVEDIRLRIGVFREYRKAVNSLEEEGNDSLSKIAFKGKKNLERLQSQEYPIIRKELGLLLDKKLWENDIDVTVSGQSNTSILFVGGMFAANKNIKDFQNTVSELLDLVRFKKSMYRWYNHADEYTYYDLKTRPDSE